MYTARKQFYYLWKKMAERNARKKLAHGYFKNDLDRYKNCTNRKPDSQIQKELKALKKYWDCYPFQYYRFDFFRSDCPFTLEEMKTYVPLFFLDALFYPVNQNGYGVLTWDKLLNYVLLKAYDVKQPELLFCFDHQKFFNNKNSRMQEAEVMDVLQKAVAAKLFIKPRSGSGGKGIYIFQKAAGTYINEQGTILDPAFFKTHIENGLYIVQEGLVQHEILNRIYPHSINTFRVITECSNGEARVLYALLRAGQGGKQVDNASSGGMYVKVDPDTGVLSDFAYAYNRKTYDKHPDTGFVFKGAQIEKWPEVKAFAQHVAEKFREIKYLGWDIAFTPNGPAVVELNNSPDMGMIQDFYGGIRNDLHIYPKDWWHRSGYTLKNQ